MSFMSRGREKLTRRGMVLFGMTVLVMVVAGGAFLNKMADFILTMLEGDVAGFGVVSVATYVLGMLPILCLPLWAVLTGRFRDIERPKFRLFELDAEIERGGELGPSPAPEAPHVR